MSGYNSKKRNASTRGGTGRTRGSGTSSGRTVHLDPVGAKTTTTVNNPYLNGVVDRATMNSGFGDILHGRDNQFLTNLSQQNSQMNQGFDDVLARFAGNSNISALLNALGFNNTKGMSESAAEDWNKQLLETLLQYNLTQENRSYNESRLEEQRLYDNPQNQLARLMGAGISRDAALQLLGQANAPITSDPAAVAAGVAPSQSDLADTQRKTAIAEAAVGGAASAASAFAGLCGVGIAIPQAMQQVKLLANQVHMSNKQVTAYDSASEAFGVLTSLGAPDSAYQGVNSATKFITQSAKDGNSVAQAFIDRGGVSSLLASSPMASQFFAEMYRNNRAGEREENSYVKNMKNLDARTNLANIQVSEVAQEIVNKQAEYAQIVASTEFIEAQTQTQTKLIEVYENQAKLLEEQGRSEQARQKQMRADALRTDLENMKTWQLYNSSMPYMATDPETGEMTGIQQRTGLEWMTFDELNKLVSSANISAKTTNPAYINAVYDDLFTSHEVLAQVNALEALKNKYGLKFFAEFPQQAELYSVLEKLGVYDYIHSVREGVYDYKSGIEGPFGLDFKSMHTGNVSLDVLDNVNESLNSKK